MDAPQHQSIYHLQLIAKDKAHWRALERNIGSGWGPALRPRTTKKTMQKPVVKTRNAVEHSIEDVISTRSVAEDAARAEAKTRDHANRSKPAITRRRSTRTANKRIDYVAMHNEGIICKEQTTASKNIRPESTVSRGPTVTILPGKVEKIKLKSAQENCAAFFRPGYAPPVHKKPKPKKKKRVILTDKERRQWARDHWRQHYAQENSADHIIQTPKSPVKTIKCALPTWSVAKAAVFDSSSDEEEVAQAPSLPCANTTDHLNNSASSVDLSDNWAAPDPQPHTHDDSDSWAVSACIPSSEDTEEPDGTLDLGLDDNWTTPTKVVDGETGNPRSPVSSQKRLPCVVPCLNPRRFQSINPRTFQSINQINQTSKSYRGIPFHLLN